MGYDAYLLSNALYNGAALPPTRGSTGLLYMDENGRVRRQLPWAEFENGMPRAKPSDGTSDSTVSDSGRDASQIISRIGLNTPSTAGR